jgi:hypothetical protein
LPVAAHSQPRIITVWKPMHRIAVSGLPPLVGFWPKLIPPDLITRDYYNKATRCRHDPYS